MLPTSLPGGIPGGITAARPTALRREGGQRGHRRHLEQGAALEAATRRSAHPSGTHTTYFTLRSVAERTGGTRTACGRLAPLLTRPSADGGGEDVGPDGLDLGGQHLEALPPVEQVGQAFG